ncbi:NADPH oxidase 5-like [Lingula anatina]|uniref:NADPH oxidase 5-like n=1 Tax=Lingula anatina TaxID=7574 RepID=A0A1S3I0I4_LINAN|nr:NADPH oxidase 5-like [Lingula anatina]|eukprot:XP_013390859.1 NADPH oxidase 5-like [Lingula anatina]
MANIRRNDPENKRLSRKITKVTGGCKEITQEEFRKIVNSKNDYLSARLFAILDKDNSKTIQLDEFISAIDLLSQGSSTDKLKFLFDVYDADDNGELSREELGAMLRACIEESSLAMADDIFSRLTSLLWDELDIDQSGSVSFDELRETLEKRPNVLENLTISALGWLKLSKDWRESVVRLPGRREIRTYIQNNAQFIFFHAVFACFNILLFLEAFVRHWLNSSHLLVCIARGTGSCLNFTSILIVILVLRQILNWVRSTWLYRFLPFDDHIALHRVVGSTIVLHAVLHGVCHTCYNAFVVKKNWGLWFIDPYVLTGWILLAILLSIFCFSLPVVRRKLFSVFFFAHHLYIPYWVILLVHGKNFWKWFLFPGLAFLVEKLMRSPCLNKKKKSKILKGEALPSKVTKLVITKPPYFYFNAGDYVLLNIPVISRYEWHPFTISSAPEEAGVFTVHIRGVGVWTNKTYQHFKVKNDVEKHCKQSLSSIGKKRKICTENTGQIRSSSAPEWLPKQEEVPGTPRRNRSNPTVIFVDESINTHSYGFIDRSLESDSVQELYLEEASTGGNQLYPCVSSSKERHISVDSGYQCETLIKNDQRPPRGVQSDPEMSLASDDDDLLEVYIDGPYGTASAGIYRAQHAVLVAAGIGVTPFASILQSIMYRFNAANHQCPDCRFCWTDDKAASLGNMKLRKVDFFWINRNQDSFEWMSSLLNQLERNQAVMRSSVGRFLDIHIYMTGAQGASDLSGLGLQLAMDLWHEEEHTDAVTGLQTRTKAGRPDWGKIFKDIAAAKHGDVTLFYCGPQILGAELGKNCTKYGFDFKQEHF